MGFLNKRSFKAKLMALCLLMSAVSVIIGLTAYAGLQKVESIQEDINRRILLNTTSLQKMYAAFKDIRINLRSIVLPGLSVAQQENFAKQVAELTDQYEKYEKEYSSLPFIQGEQELAKELAKEWDAFKVVSERVLALQKSGNATDFKQMNDIFLKEGPESAERYEKHFEKLMTFHQADSEKIIKKAETVQTAANITMVSVGFVGSLLCLLVGWFFANSVAKNLGDIVNILTRSSEEVTTSSLGIASASQQLSQATTEQASSLEETASAIEELSSMVTKNSENARNAAQSTEETQTKATRGKDSVERMMHSMEEINSSNEHIMSQVNESNAKMADIVKVIQEIGNRTKVINDIVFQTKLLSFNASVEAARAGEHGKGFAVVAEEVGNLAQMSGNAAKEISQMLDESIRKVESIVDETKSNVESLIVEGKEKINSGVGVAQECGDILNEIVENVSSVAHMAGEISGASQEQTQGIGEINKAVAQLNQVTQQNASASSQTANSAAQLSAEAESLKKVIHHLTVTIYGETGSPTSEGNGKSAQTTGTKSSNLVKAATKNSKLASVTKSMPSNVVPMKRKPAPAPSQSVQNYKLAAGDDAVPHRDDPGFGE